MQPLLLGSNMREDNAIFTVDLTNPDMFSMERVVVLEKDTLHIKPVGLCVARYAFSAPVIAQP